MPAEAVQSQRHEIHLALARIARAAIERHGLAAQLRGDDAAGDVDPKLGHRGQAPQSALLHRHEVSEVHLLADENRKKPLIDGVERLEAKRFNPALPARGGDVDLVVVERAQEFVDRVRPILAVAVHHDDAVGFEVFSDIAHADRDGALVSHIAMQPQHDAGQPGLADPRRLHRLAHGSVVDGDDMGRRAEAYAHIRQQIAETLAVLIDRHDDNMFVAHPIPHWPFAERVCNFRNAAPSACAEG